MPFTITSMSPTGRLSFLNISRVFVKESEICVVIIGRAFSCQEISIHNNNTLSRAWKEKESTLNKPELFCSQSWQQSSLLWLSDDSIASRRTILEHIRMLQMMTQLSLQREGRERDKLISLFQISTGALLLDSTNGNFGSQTTRLEWAFWGWCLLKFIKDF